jgi:hypothetical protein
MPRFRGDTTKEMPRFRGNTSKENAAFPRHFHYRRRRASNYFETDFLNMRSIFSLVASQQAWLA